MEFKRKCLDRNFRKTKYIKATPNSVHVSGNFSQLFGILGLIGRLGMYKLDCT